MPEGHMKLLVVDDEDSISDYIARLYEKRGFKSFTAKTGEAGLEIFERERPDVTIIDVFLVESQYDGVELLSRIRRIDKDALCIIMSRITSPETVEKAKQLGIMGYFFKPIAVEELHGVMGEAVAKLKGEGDGESAS